MKKIMTSILLVFLTFYLAACSGNSPMPLPSGGETTVSVRYEIGDIILSDGSVVRSEDYSNVDTDNLPVAVVAQVKDDGTVLGIGVHRSEEPLQWAADVSGSYPAFDFVNTYGEIYNLYGDYASGWYMPDITELSAIYENCRDINAALRKIHGFDDKAAMDGLETNWYWASTQSDNDDDYAWFIHFLNGYSCDCPKNFTNLHVLAVRIL